MWPENWNAVLLFKTLGTQWRTSLSGVTGLDYNVLFRLMDEQGVTGDEWSRLFDDIQVMEVQAMETMRAN